MKTFRITFLIAIISFGLRVAAYSQSAGEFAVPLSDPSKRGTLTAKLNTGSITVKGTARKDVLVKYTQRAERHRKHDDDDDDDDGDDDDCDDCKKNSHSDKGGLRRISSGTIDLEANESGNHVRISSDSWSNAIDLTIEVPAGMDMKVKAYNDGDIIITDVDGEVEVTNYNGEITARNISGSVVAATYNGHIRIGFDKIKEGTPMSFSTYNGDIDLTLPSTVKASLKMKTERGEIYSGFDVNLVKSAPIQKKEAGAGTFKITVDEWVKGDVNGGGPEFTMKNYNGDILLRKKQ